MPENTMIFFDMWEEFEKQYGFHDSKQAYMFGNTRIILSFRIQQWLDYIEDMRYKRQFRGGKNNENRC